MMENKEIIEEREKAICRISQIISQNQKNVLIQKLIQL